MRLYSGLAFVILLAGSVQGIDRVANVDEGASYTFTVITMPYTVDKCHLKTPTGQVIDFVPGDQTLSNDKYVVGQGNTLAACELTLNNADKNDNGAWEMYFTHEGEVGSTQAYVMTIGSSAPTNIAVTNLRWNVEEPVNITLGPENAVYCRIEDPFNHIIFDGFSQCQINLERVGLDHKGMWRMHVGVPGSVMLQTTEFYVSFEHESPTVTIGLQKDGASVLMSCSIPAEYEVKACTFRTPHGDTLVAAHGAGAIGSNYESETTSHGCTLRLVQASIADFGIWRCAMHTTTGTYHGFQLVACPFHMQNPEIAAAVETEPVLRLVSEKDLSYEEFEPAVMSCSIQTVLRYCYFRTRNGTVYSVFPGMSSSLSYEYVGAGLEAGDCGIRFKNGLTEQEGGAWSCHAGLTDTTAPEQRVSFNVEVRAQLSVDLKWHPADPTTMVLEITSPYDIDYCRFVRMDGLGFTADNMPAGYDIHNQCTLHIKNPTILEIHPWSVAVKFTGKQGEVSLTSGDLFNLPTQDPEAVADAPTPNILSAPWFWLIVVLFGLLCFIIGFALVPKKNREWTYGRASNMSNNFRNSWSKAFDKKLKEETAKAEGRV